MRRDRCRTPGCGAEVIFVASATTGRPMILDAKPTKGVVVGDSDPGRASTIVASVVDVYTDHHATCPGAKEWQGRTRKHPPVRSIAPGIDVEGMATVTAIAAATEPFLSMHCQAGRHGVCLWIYGGRRCSCQCGHPLVPDAPKSPGVRA